MLLAYAWDVSVVVYDERESRARVSVGEAIVDAEGIPCPLPTLPLPLGVCTTGPCTCFLCSSSTTPRT